MKLETESNMVKTHFGDDKETEFMLTQQHELNSCPHHAALSHLITC